MELAGPVTLSRHDQQVLLVVVGVALIAYVALVAVPTGLGLAWLSPLGRAGRLAVGVVGGVVVPPAVTALTVLVLTTANWPASLAVVPAAAMVIAPWLLLGAGVAARQRRRQMTPAAW